MELETGGETIEDCLWCGIPEPCGKPVCRNKHLTVRRPAKALDSVKVPPLYRESSAFMFDDQEQRFGMACKDMEHGGAFIAGPAGTGKTTFATAIMKERLMSVVHDTGWDAIWVTAPELLARIRATYQQGAVESEQEVMKLYSGVKLLLIDDLGAEKVSDWSMSAFYSILSRRINYMLFTIVTSNMSLDSIAEWEPRIASRLMSMKCMNMTGDDRRQNAHS